MRPPLITAARRTAAMFSSEGGREGGREGTKWPRKGELFNVVDIFSEYEQDKVNLEI